VVRVIRSIFSRSEDLPGRPTNKGYAAAAVFPQNVERNGDLRHTSRRSTMSGSIKKIFFVLTIGALIVVQPADAGSLGDFFKALGNSIAHPGQGKKPAPKTQTKKPKTKGGEQTADYPPVPAPPTPPPTPTPTATTTQPPVRIASAPPIKNSKRDIPYGIPVPNKPGFVTSPYSPKAGYVDVRGFPSGTEVKDPYSGKIFLTP
jgi:hypothetical protein